MYDEKRGDQNAEGRNGQRRARVLEESLPNAGPQRYTMDERIHDEAGWWRMQRSGGLTFGSLKAAGRYGQNGEI